MCRASASRTRGCHKTAGRRLGVRELPDPWLDLLRRSRDWRMEEYDDPQTAAEALAFIGWAGGQAAR
jgi:hypothetical protein